MKKWIFIIALLLFVAVSSAVPIFADTWHGEDYGAGTVNSVFFVCYITPGESTSTYDFTVSSSSSKEIIIDALYAVDSSGNKTKYGGSSVFEENLTGIEYFYYANGFVIDNTVDIAYFSISFRHPFDNYTTSFDLKSTNRYTVEPTVAPTPDIPEPTPELDLQYIIKDSQLVCSYYTGGCETVSSILSLQRKNALDDFNTIESKTFNDGAGIFKYDLVDHTEYRLVLTYNYYDSAGAYKVEVKYSDVFSLPEVTPEVTPDITPEVTPDITPEITPDVTPEITPEITPDITPDITPEAEPDIWVKVDNKGLNVKCDYYSGGMESVSSVFELQWYLYGKDNASYIAIGRDEYIDGLRKFERKIYDGEWYRAKVTYIYIDSSGKQTYKEIYSEYFQGYIPEESPVVIWNLKSLMKWCWDELMEIPITYEGFTVTFKQIYLFVLITPTLILFFVYFTGMYGVGFLFGHGAGKVNESPAADDPVALGDTLDPEDTGLGWENVGKKG